VIGAALVSAYCLLGASWLIDIKSEGELQFWKAVRWGQTSLFFTMAGIAAILLPRRWCKVSLTNGLPFPTSCCCCPFRWPRPCISG
jgi:cytochrome bd-type quinol oxidase subunit 2